MKPMPVSAYYVISVNMIFGGLWNKQEGRNGSDPPANSMKSTSGRDQRRVDHLQTSEDSSV